MLTRLEVDGFKNLDGLDVRLGPLTCIAGPNGVGKSNLFDAISFLAALADRPLMEAAATVRGGDSRRGDGWGIFLREGDRVAERMRFAAEFLIPVEGEDELGQTARASMTFLRYELELRCRRNSTVRTMGALEIVHEEMAHVNCSEAKNRLGFPHKTRWRDSVVTGRRTSAYISTDPGENGAVVSLHADSAAGLGGGRRRRVPAASLPRTMLSSVNNAAEHRTLVLARQEMAGWTQLQLEPSALRAPDDFTASTPTIRFGKSSSTRTRRWSWPASATTRFSWHMPVAAAHPRRRGCPCATCRARGVRPRNPTNPRSPAET